MYHRGGLLCIAACAAAIGFGPSAAQADLVIEFTGINLVYDGSALYDAGSPGGGVGNPADADALVSLDFILSGNTIGSLSNDIWLDFYIPDVVNIPVVANSAHNFTTPGNLGFFDILIGTGPVASEYLMLDINSVSITFIDVFGAAQFIFGATISSSFAQNLPFGPDFVGDVTISFSAQIVQGTLTDNGQLITGFDAFGTGEVTGAVPTPGVLALLALAGIAARGRKRRA